MSQLRHLAAAEARASWPILSLAVVIHSVRVLVVETSPRWAEGGRGLAILQTLDWPMALVELIAYALSVSLVVHRDPLVGPRAFWLTRPIPPRTLLAAKLMVCGAGLVLVPVLINAGRLAAYGASLSAVVAASLQLALSRGFWMVLFWLLAAVTASTVAFAIAALGVVLLAFLALMAVMAVLINNSPTLADMQPRAPQLHLPDHTESYLALVGFLAGGLAVASWQHRARRALVAVAAAVGVLAATIFVPWSSVPAFARAEAPPTPRWAEATGPVRVTMPDTAIGRESSRLPRGLRIASLSATFQVEGLPASFSATVCPLESRLTLADGRRVEGRGHPWSDWSADVRLATVLRSGTPAPAGALVAPRPLPLAGAARATLMVTSEDDLRPFAGQTPRLETTLEVRLLHHRVVGILPLIRGAAIRGANGNLFEIVRVIPQPREIRLWTRRTVFPSAKAALATDIVIGFHDRARREWLHSPEWQFGASQALPGFLLTLPDVPGSWTTPWGAAWLATHEVALSIPEESDPDARVRDVSIVVFESSYAGRVERRFTQNAAYLKPLEAGRQ